MKKMKKILVHKLVALAELSVSCILFIVAISVKQWATGSSENNGVLIYDIQKGIWRTCIETQAFGNVCGDTEYINEPEAKLHTIQAFFIMAIIAYVVSFVSLALSFKIKKLSLVLVIANILLAIFLLIGLAVAVDSITDKDSRVDKNWASGVGWGAFGLSVSAVFMSISVARCDMKADS